MNKTHIVLVYAIIANVIQINDATQVIYDATQLPKLTAKQQARFAQYYKQIKLSPEDQAASEKMFSLFARARRNNAESTKRELTQLIIKHPSIVNSQNDYLSTPLMFAVRSRYKDIIQLLINNGAKINTQGRDGETALMWAARYGSDDGSGDILELLFKAGADANIKNDSNKTAVDIAKENGIDEEYAQAIKQKESSEIKRKEENS
jgi:ankyrin repeat protein